MSAATIWEVPAPASAPSPRPRLRLVPTGPAAARSSVGGLRLTRRGRLAITTAVAVALVVLGLALARVAVAAPAAPQRSVTVPAGATLSEIAARELPDLPVAEGVAELRVVNDLATDQVRAGQVLVVPQG